VTDTFMRKSPRSRVPCQTTTCTDTFEYDARDRLITEVRTRSGADVRRTSYELWDHGAVKWEHAPEGDFFHQYDGVRLGFVRGPGGTSYHHYDDDGNLDCVTLDADAPEACASATTDNPAGYTAYGEEDKTLTAESDPDQPEGSQTPPAAGEETNPFRFTGKRQDSSSETLDMGVRRFAPDVAAFAQPDLYENAFDNLDLAQDPLTANRYALAGGNPISFVEVDGHWPEFVDDAVRHGRGFGRRHRRRPQGHRRVRGQRGQGHRRVGLQLGQLHQRRQVQGDLVEHGGDGRGDRQGPGSGRQERRQLVRQPDQGELQEGRAGRRDHARPRRGRGSRDRRQGPDQDGRIGRAGRSGGRGGRPGCNSFVGGTLVLLASGDTLPIEQIAEGDAVPRARRRLGRPLGRRPHHPLPRRRLSRPRV